MSGTREVARSAVTGRFVRLTTAYRSPSTTVIEVYPRLPVRRTSKRRSR